MSRYPFVLNVCYRDFNFVSFHIVVELLVAFVLTRTESIWWLSFMQITNSTRKIEITDTLSAYGICVVDTQVPKWQQTTKRKWTKCEKISSTPMPNKKKRGRGREWKKNCSSQRPSGLFQKFHIHAHWNKPIQMRVKLKNHQLRATSQCIRKINHKTNCTNQMWNNLLFYLWLNTLCLCNMFHLAARYEWCAIVVWTIHI